MLERDIPVDFVAFPDQVIPTKSNHIRPAGIDWGLLPEAKVKAIPLLRGLAEREPASGGT